MRYPHALAKTLGILAATILVLSALGLLPAPLGRTGPAAAATSSTSGSPGYWLVGNNGEVFQVGTANYGDLRSRTLTRPIVGAAATPDGRGYWMVGSDGGMFAYGDAGYFGSTGAMHLNRPIVGMAATPDGRGYWLVASDGGIFTFGSINYYGSTGAIRLNKPIVGMASSHDGFGYWMVASDGGIFTFGDAGYHGSTGAIHLNAPIIGMSASPSGNGYWLAGSDGGVFSFGDAPPLGAAGTNGTPPIAAFMATSYGLPFPPGSTGYDVSKWNCPPNGTLPTARTFGIVEIAGNINAYFNPCYQSEASWAGRNMSSYIFMNPMPSPAPQESLTGPAGTCNGSVSCEAYNFGYYWAGYWVDKSRSLGVLSSMWWLDVEFGGGWGTSSASYPNNDNVIAGAVAGLRSRGVVAGIYATSYQWGLITGNQVNFPQIPLWEAGADTINDSTDPYSATAVCAGHVAQHLPFAGGKIVVVQYGWGPNGETYSTDPDYACT